jgi:cytochrome c-type biogenesis protein
LEISASAVFVAGLLTFVSPCVLPLVPIYLGILAGSAQEGAPPSRFRSVGTTALFAVGFALVFSILGLSATAAGAALVRHKLLLQQVGGIVVLLLGLRFLGYLNLPFLQGGTDLAHRWKTRFVYLNALLLGLLFAFAWTPCIGAVLGAVLTYTALATSEPLEGMGYLALYSLGFALPLLAVSAIAGPALAALRKVHRFLPVFEKVTGGLLIVTGFLLVTDRMGLIDAAFSNPPPPQAIMAARPSPDASQAQAPGPGTPVEGTTCAPESGAVCEPTGPRPALLEFYSPQCSICRQMIPTVNALKHECQGKQVDFRPVDVTSPQGRALAQKYGVTGIPVFVFLDAGGKEVARLVGYQRLVALEQAMSVLLGEECAYRPLPALKGGG